MRYRSTVYVGLRHFGQGSWILYGWTSSTDLIWDHQSPSNNYKHAALRIQPFYLCQSAWTTLLSSTPSSQVKNYLWTFSMYQACWYMYPHVPHRRVILRCIRIDTPMQFWCRQHPMLYTEAQLYIPFDGMRSWGYFVALKKLSAMIEPVTTDVIEGGIKPTKCALHYSSGALRSREVGYLVI